MNETGEALGTGAEGGLLARVIGRKNGARAAPATPDEGHFAEEACLNCGTALQGPHCHSCGQKAHLHRTLGAFLHDLLHGALHFEGSIWRTLPMLALKPGELTRRYIDGERARFVSPVALFLFSVFLTFAVFSAIGGPYAAGRTSDQAEAASDPRREQSRAREELRQLALQREALGAGGDSTAAVDRRIEDVEDELGALAIPAMARGGGGEEPEASSDEAFRKLVEEIATGETDLPRPVQEALRRMAEANLSLLIYKIQANAYKFSWSLIPISAPFVWMLFLHRRRLREFGAYDHMVFVTYSITFMSLFLVALSLLRPLGLGESLADLAIVLIPPIHIYRQLRGAYGIGRWSAVWRAFALMIFAIVAATLFFMLLVTVGVMG